ALTASISVRPILPPAPAMTMRCAGGPATGSPAEEIADTAPPAMVVGADGADDAVLGVAGIAANRRHGQLVIAPPGDLVVLELDRQPMIVAQAPGGFEAIYVVPA